MPANNRMSTDVAFRSHGIWDTAITTATVNDAAAAPKDDKPSMQSLMNHARSSGALKDRPLAGACRKCGGCGHLTFQCRNFIVPKKKLSGHDIPANAPTDISGHSLLQSTDRDSDDSSDFDGDESPNEVTKPRSDRRKSLSHRSHKRSRRRSPSESSSSSSSSSSRSHKRRQRSSKSHRRSKRSRHDDSSSSDSDDSHKRNSRKERKDRKQCDRKYR